MCRHWKIKTSGGDHKSLRIKHLPQERTRLLTTGIDTGADFVGGKGNDTFTASNAAGAMLFTALDTIDGGAGTGDTMNLAIVGNVTTVSPAGATVTNVENINLTSSGTIVADFTAGYTGVTSVIASGVGGSTVTVGTGTALQIADTGAITATGGTTQVLAGAGALTSTGASGAVTASMSAAAATTAAIQGGTNVALTLTGVTAGGAVNIGTTTAPTGTVNVSVSELATQTTTTAKAINVTGGTTVAVTANLAGAVNNTITGGVVTVTGTALTTNVSVTQTAAVTAAAAVSGVANGAVNITDVNAGTATADKITTVTLSSYGASTIDSAALTNLNLSGTGGTLAINRTTSDTTANATTLNLAVTGASTLAAITGTHAADFTTVNLSATGATTIADLQAAAATAVNISGAGALTLTADTFAAAAVFTSTSTGGVTLTQALGTGQQFVGTASSGADVIGVGATTKAITTGAGNDTVTFSAAAVGTGGSIAAGDGTGDTLSMTSANAATASSTAALGTAFTTTVTGFEKLVVTGGGTNTVNVARLGGFTDISTAGDTALTLDGVTTGSTIRLTATGTAQTVNSTAALQTSLNDSLNLVLTGVTTAADVAFSTTGLTATDVETINITSSYDSSMTAANKTAATTGSFANGMIVLGNQVKTIVVGGEAGLNLAATSTALTSLDASSNTVGSAGEFSWTSGATTAAVTVKGLASGINTIVLTNATVAGTYTGSANGDTVTIGNALANVLNLGDGTNLVNGTATGNNVITGGSGSDTFITGTTGNNVINFGDGANTFQATTGNNTYTGGKDVDNVTVTTGANTISTGAGNDVITVGSVTTVGVNSINVGTGTDSVTVIGQSVNSLAFSTITGMGVGDTLVLNGGTAALGTPTFTTAKVADLGAMAVFTDYLAAASAAGATANSNIAWFQFGGNTYVVEDNSDALTFQTGVDSVVCLAGLVTINGFTAAANVATFVLA